MTQQERKDRINKWMFIQDDDRVNINCGNCAHTIITIDAEKNPDILDQIIKDLPECCPLCKMKMSKIGLNFIKDKLFSSPNMPYKGPCYRNPNDYGEIK